MSKKKKKNKETTIENFYDLKVDQMNDLVDALKGGEETKKQPEEDVSMDIGEITDGQASGKKFNPYHRDKLSAIPAWIKALFIKWWFAGCTCYFFMWGLPTSINALDQMFLVGIVYGFVNELLVNPTFRFLESDEKDFDNFIMFPFPFKAYWTFFANAIYYLIVVALVWGIYILLGTTLSVYGVEPLLFGTFCLIVDMFFIGIKDLIVYLVKRRKKSGLTEEDILNV